MKKQLQFATVCLVIVTTFCRAQNPTLWGMTPRTWDNGNIFNVTAGGVETDTHNFSGGADGNSPATGALIEAHNGLLYGMTQDGGANGDGTIFSYNISSGVEIDLYNFGSSITDGTFPYSSLVQASDGLLYGLTSQGGNNGYGMMFSYNITTGIETDIYDFGIGADGRFPLGSLIQANDSLLYGMTYTGGTRDSGTIFTYNISTGNYAVAYNFGSGADGAWPYGSLMQASNGLLYGMTYVGGNKNAGTIFSYNISTGKETNVHSFGGVPDGQNPWGSLIQATDTLLYGMTELGGVDSVGTIFSYNILTGKETVLHNFYSYFSDGYTPLGSLIQAANGVLYGMTANGGVNDDGIIFSYNIKADTETNLFDFYTLKYSGGSTPVGSFMQASNGLLYGMTELGGAYKVGELLSYDITTSTETDDVHDFGLVTDGILPEASLIKAGNGLLYGMTQLGAGAVGSFGNGTIFSYDISTSRELDLYNFGSKKNDGIEPLGSLIQVNDSLLYGMTWEGGAYGYYSQDGIIFSYNILSNEETIVYNFGNGSDGALPQGSLILSNDSLLYGMTSKGGTKDAGTIFRYNVSKGKETVMYNFGGGATDGANPYGSLLLVNDSMLYGMTYGGGFADSGIIFSYNMSTGKETDIHNFAGGADGARPYGSLIITNNGFLYGITSAGGTQDSGIIFSYDISGSDYTVLHNFGGSAYADGSAPSGSLYLASNGLLYGMTDDGGANDIDNYGTIFSYNTSTGYESVIYTFTGTDGKYPYYNNLIEVDPIDATPFNVAICKGSTVTLAASGATTYTWAPATGLSATTGNSVVANPTVTTVYTVTGTSSAGWTSAQTDVVTVIPTPNTPIISRHGDTLFSNMTNNNQWYLNDSLLQNETSQYIIPTADGWYSVAAISNSNSCSALSDSIKIDSVAGINRLSANNNQLSIYPNPTSGQFTIKTNGNQNGYTAEIYNVMGEEVYQSVLSNSQNIINLSSQPAGLYFVYLKSEEGVEVGKVMVTK